MMEQGGHFQMELGASTQAEEDVVVMQMPIGVVELDGMEGVDDS